MLRNNPAIQLPMAIITKLKYKIDVANDKDEIYKLWLKDLKKTIKKEYVSKDEHEEKLAKITKKLFGLDLNDAIALKVLLDGDIKGHLKPGIYAGLTQENKTNFPNRLDKFRQALITHMSRNKTSIPIDPILYQTVNEVIPTEEDISNTAATKV